VAYGYQLITDHRSLASTLDLVIFIAIWTLEHSFQSYLSPRNIIRKKVSTTTTNVLKSPARFSSYKRSRYAALVILSFSVDRSCSFLRFSNNSAFNYNHLLYHLSFLMYIFIHIIKLSNMHYHINIKENLCDSNFIASLYPSYTYVHDYKTMITIMRPIHCYLYHTFRIFSLILSTHIIIIKVG
jgi:hypothetical protein